MADYKLCSVNKVISEIYTDFKPSNSGWNYDAIEWIGDAIDIMKVGVGYCNTWRDIEVLDYRGKLPCDFESMLGILYNGCRLKKNGGIPIRREWNCNFAISGDTYTLNPNYINTSFKEGTIRVYYYGLPVDCDGFPLVVDTAKYRQALKWYVLMKMVGRGFKHPVFTSYKELKQLWEEAYPQAQNDCKMPDIDTMENWKLHYCSTVKNLHRADELFRTAGTFSEAGAFSPGSLLQTYKILGNTLVEPTTPTSITTIEGVL